jgi:nitrate reductase NapAB chaperone NapD
VTIRSYLIHVRPGARGDVAQRLAALPGCDVHPSLNRDVVIVVAESEDRDDSLDAALAAIEGVAGVALVSGFSEVR